MENADPLGHLLPVVASCYQRASLVELGGAALWFKSEAKGEGRGAKKKYKKR